jgi:methylmalonyl-CoA/ethylmalonyl-CoA epimerase
MIRDGYLHHVGYVVESISACVEGFARSLNTHWDGKVYADPNQSASVTFLYPGAPGNPAIELVEPLGERATTRRFLRDGGGLHHVCYEVSDLAAALASRTSQEAKLVRKALPAVAFGLRPAAWIYTRQGLLLELLEAEPERREVVGVAPHRWERSE